MSMMFLTQAKRWIQENLNTGVRCPCCEQYCKLYKRKLNSTMAAALVLIYRHFEDNPNEVWLHVPEFLVRTKADATIAGGDVAKLKYWGLLEPQHGERADGSNRVGFWRLTQKGRDFVEGTKAVPRYAFVFNQKCVRMSEEKTTIRTALGDRFSFDELMRD